MRNIFEYINNFNKIKNIKSILKLGDLSAVANPVISVIIPCYKRPEFLRTAIHSVLNQDFKGKYEIIVVDNNDTEYINENQIVVEKFNNDKILYYKNEKNIGMYGNWNRGIELANAPYIVFCHDDDTLCPYSLSILYQLESENKGKAIFGAHNIINSDGQYIINLDVNKKKKYIFKPLNKFNYNKWDVFLSSPGFGCGCLFQKDRIIELGGYNEEFYPSADYAFNAQYIFKYGGIYTSFPTFNYRLAENESLNVYHKFAEADRHFRNCMIDNLKCPNFILNRIIEAKYNYNKISFAIKWGNLNKKELRNVPLIDRAIVELINCSTFIKRHKFTL